LDISTSGLSPKAARSAARTSSKSAFAASILAWLAAGLSPAKRFTALNM
jgi:hypothetical protein